MLVLYSGQLVSQYPFTDTNSHKYDTIIPEAGDNWVTNSMLHVFLIIFLQSHILYFKERKNIKEKKNQKKKQRLSSVLSDVLSY